MAPVALSKHASASGAPAADALARPAGVALVTRDFARTTLKARHRRVVRAATEAMFSPDGEVAPERLDAVVDDLDGFISPASKTLRFGLLLLMTALRWSPLFYLRATPFEELSVDERARHLERLERSRLKQLPLLVIALKTMLTMIFYEDEGELRAIGYPGPARERYKRGLAIAPPAPDPAAGDPSAPARDEAST